MADTNNYVLGKGELHFAPFKTGTQNPSGERYLGNTPELALTIETQDLDHFSSDRGIREKDDSVVLEVTRRGNFTCDNIDPKNLAVFFFGAASALAQTGATVTAEAIADVVLGTYYQLGVSDVNPTGVRALDLHSTGPDVKIVVKKGATTFVEGDDYTIDMDLARLYIMPAGDIVDGDDITVDYKTKTATRDHVISGSQAIEGSLRLIARNPKGANYDYFLPWAKLTPNGDFALKGEDWMTIPFNIEALRKTGLEAIYLDGRAVTA